jgi:hypothetical protein
MKYGTSDIWGESDYQSQWNDEVRSKPPWLIKENLTGCLQRYVVHRYERKWKAWMLNTKNIVVQIICREEHNFNFHRRNRDIHSFTFSNLSIITLVHFNRTFGTTITHDNVTNAERYEYYWQQWRIWRQIHKEAMNVRANGMRNRSLNTWRSTNENLTGCLQRYVVLRYERKWKYLKFKISSIML